MTVKGIKTALKVGLKFLHEELTGLLAEFPGVLWFGMFVDVFVLLALVFGALDCTGNLDKDSPIRMVMLIHGIVNSLFYIIAGLVIVGDDPLDHESTTEERRKRYSKITAPMLILFPLLMPMWSGIIVSIIIFSIGAGIYSLYKRLEDKVLK